MPFSVGLKLQERSNSGYPDFTFTWARLTSWWEVKFYNNRMFESTEIQHTTCRRLNQAGHCHYIIYERHGALKRVLILHPHATRQEFVDTWRDAHDFAFGFNHAWVSAFIRNLHLTHLQAGPIVHP